LTYLGTPDLKYESNWIINTFSMGWLEIMCSTAVGIAFIIILVIKAEIFLIEHKSKKSFHKFLFCLVIIFFYTHFIYSIYVVINNCLSIIYLHAEDDFVIKKLSIKYVHFYNKDITWYNIFTHSVSFCAGLIVSIFRIERIRR
jgi:hypothetical protein